MGTFGRWISWSWGRTGAPEGLKLERVMLRCVLGFTWPQCGSGDIGSTSARPLAMGMERGDMWQRGWGVSFSHWGLLVPSTRRMVLVITSTWHAVLTKAVHLVCSHSPQTGWQQLLIAVESSPSSPPSLISDEWAWEGSVSMCLMFLAQLPWSVVVVRAQAACDTARAKAAASGIEA